MTLGPLIHNIPEALAPSSSSVSKSVILAVTSGIGRPTVPSFLSIWELPTERLGGTLTDTNGDNSVAPYPSTGRILNFPSKASAKSFGNFSAPVMAISTDAKSSGLQRRRNPRRNVGVAKSIVPLCRWQSLPICLPSRGLK